jgi:glucan 1,3-beta-glucosidase
MAIFLLYGLVAVLWTASALDVTWDESQTVIGPSKSHTAKENCSSWLEEISDYGVAPFASPGYRVFRNVKDYGAKGDGHQDDTNAIISAISDGGRCDLLTCASSTRTPATVYFPSGTYYISKEIPVSYYTNLIGNPRCLPILKATKNFNGSTFIMGRATSIDRFEISSLT